MTLTNIEHTRGDTFSRTLQFNDTAGTAINLTGSTIKMTVKYNPDDTSYITQSTATLTAPSAGTATISIAGSDLQLDNGNYYYDIQWTDSGGVITTFLKGFLVISFDVTN